MYVWSFCVLLVLVLFWGVLLFLLWLNIFFKMLYWELLFCMWFFSVFWIFCFIFFMVCFLILYVIFLILLKKIFWCFVGFLDVVFVLLRLVLLVVWWLRIEEGLRIDLIGVMLGFVSLEGFFIVDVVIGMSVFCLFLWLSGVICLSC